MYGNDGTVRNIDVLIENLSSGERFYLYCIIGETKEHTGAGIITYNQGNTQIVNGQGIYQTGISVKNGISAGPDAGDASIIEFMGNTKTTNLKFYRVIEILVY